MRKKILEKRLARLKDKKADLAKRALASDDAAEVRSINAEIEDINADIEETQDELDALDAEPEAPAEDTRSAVPDNAQLVNGATVASFSVQEAPEERGNDPHDSMEYRKAFMKYVQTGHVERSAISTEETGVMIPTTIMNQVINTVRKKYGNLYSKVRKLNIPGGVEVPIGSLSATFKWINESTVSPRQKTDKLGKVSFSYFPAEIRVAQTFLSQILTLSAFEQEASKIIAKAYLKAMDEGIVLGSGDGCMTGILNDARVTNSVTLTASEINNWVQWKKKFFSKLPLGYRDGEFIFPVSTVDAYLATMADSNNNPIFKQATGLEVNDGDSANPNGRFFGRDISLVEEDIIEGFDTASAGDCIGIFWQPDQYAINENFGFRMTRYFDQETNEWVDKALTVVDGKVLNPNGFYKLIKG